MRTTVLLLVLTPIGNSSRARTPATCAFIENSSCAVSKAHCEHHYISIVVRVIVGVVIRVVIMIVISIAVRIVVKALIITTCLHAECCPILKCTRGRLVHLHKC